MVTHKNLTDQINSGAEPFNNFLRLDGRRNPERRDIAEKGLPVILDPATSLGVRFEAYRKTAETYAIQIHVPFLVDTIEGPQQEGQPGDFLVLGAAGEMYPVAMDIFLNTYELIH